jgi:hypothetical protein
MIVISALNDLQMSESNVYGSYLNWWTIGIPVFKFMLPFFHKKCMIHVMRVRGWIKIILWLYKILCFMKVMDQSTSKI